jgi:DNA polymerase III delta subunit
MIHIKDLNTTDNNFLVENITASSFLSEKKLVIIDIEKDIPSEKEDFLLKILDKIPDDNIVLFNSINPDKRVKFYKELIKKAEVKEFNTKDDSDLYAIISKKYSSKISNQAIYTIIKYKS